MIIGICVMVLCKSVSGNSVYLYKYNLFIFINIICLSASWFSIYLYPIHHGPQYLYPIHNARYICTMVLCILVISIPCQSALYICIMVFCIFFHGALHIFIRFYCILCHDAVFTDSEKLVCCCSNMPTLTGSSRAIF